MKREKAFRPDRIGSYFRVEWLPLALVTLVFLISHRLYHFPQMRSVIFMEDGKATVGTHGELMASVPVYRQLYESQAGGQAHE